MTLCTTIVYQQPQDRGIAGAILHTWYVFSLGAHAMVTMRENKAILRLYSSNCNRNEGRESLTCG